MSLQRIESPDDPRLDMFRALKRTNTTRYFADQFVAEGVTVVERLLQSDLTVTSLLVTEGKADAFHRCLPEAVPTYVITRELASQLVGYRFHMGVMASACRPRNPRPREVLPQSGPSLVLVADHVIDPQNVGLLVRIAAGLGADALVCTAGTADPFSRRAIRVSTGNCFRIPIILTSHEAEFSEVIEMGYESCAAVLSESALDLRNFDFSDRTAMVFGNETHGISQGISQLCCHHVTIAMFRGTDSLNVAVSAGIFGYAYRMRHPQASSTGVMEP